MSTFMVEKADVEEEARKEELRRFVKEKWRRIRELERQGSPSNSSMLSEQEMGPSKARRDSIHRSSAVRYDPENPFDDRGNHTAKVRQEKKEVKMQKGEKLRKQKRENQMNSFSSISTARRQPLRSISPPGKQERANESIDASQALIKEKVERAKARRSYAEGDNFIAWDNKGRSEAPHLKASKPEQAVTPDDAALPREQGLDYDITHSGRAIEGMTTKKLLADIETVNEIVVREDDTPTRRRKRRSEVAHYQPSTSPLSLSIETSHALAELEASLARLKAHGPRTSSSKDRQVRAITEKKAVHNSNTAERKTITSTTRRSLSPSKELRRLEMLQMSDERISAPKLSFLQRVEEANREEDAKASKFHSSPPLGSTIMYEACSSSRNSVEEKKHKEKFASFSNISEVRRRPRASYTPTKRESQGRLSDESSCSIVIGDESVDDMLLRHQENNSRDFLKGVRVLVDVRDQDGENASAGWVEKLRSVGAKVYTNIPAVISSSKEKDRKSRHRKMTHIVFKNGRPATTQYLRSISSDAYNGDEPIIVGVNWILQCLKQGEKVDERDFLVEIGKQAIFNKRRTSMTPKQPSALETKGHQQQSLAELLAKKKTIQRAPAQPSPLARRCWNLNASTSSSVSATTS